MQRASYQHHNPNMSIHKVVKPKKPYLLFKDSDGLTFTKNVTEHNLRIISSRNPTMTRTTILIDLLHGRSFGIANGVSVTLTFK